MSQTQRQNRLATDFSIARILADDSDEKRRKKFSHFYVDDFSRRDQRVFLQNGSNEAARRSFSQEDIDKIESFECSRLGDDCANNFRANYRSRSGFGNFEETFDTPNERISGVKIGESASVAMKSSKNEKNELSWLQCTRYRPPKIPRKSAAGKSGKRRPGAHPRIPFTANQLQVLEDKYRRTAYLSRRDVIHLSTALRLPQSRVKIWFQNRRARDRRESSVSNATILSNDVSSDDKPKNLPDEKPMTQIHI